MPALLLMLLACEPTPPPTTQPQAPPTPQAAAPQPPPPPPAAPAPDSPEGQALVAASAAAKAFGGELKARLGEALAAGGPPEGISVCSTDAPEILASAAKEHGVSIGRSSLRLRNPDNAGPDWVAAWLAEQGERPIADASVKREIHKDGEQLVARLAVPIGVDAVCLACHGPADSLSPEVVAGLAATYPADAATGYAVGDLRGVLWVEKAIDNSPSAAPQ